MLGCKKKNKNTIPPIKQDIGFTKTIYLVYIKILYMQ